MKLVIAAVVFGVLLSANTAWAAVSDGWLVRAEGDAKIYYVDNGVKRYISAPETLLAQGLDKETVHVVSAAELASLPEGERLFAESAILLPGEADVLPDLAPLAMREVHYAIVAGRKVIKFSSLFLNQGAGTMELVAAAGEDPNRDGVFNTFERIVRANGQIRDVLVGDFLWHQEHDHYHYNNFADYVLRFVRPLDGDIAAPPPVITNKTTFCLRDDVAVILENGLPVPRVFGGACNKLRQGVSVGWADNYPSTLPDQFIDVQDLPAGIYRLEFLVDPLNRFLEMRRDNNLSVVLLELRPAQNLVKVLASAAPFSTKDNVFENGLLVRGDDRPGVFVMHNNRKFPLRTEDMFLSRGFSWDDVHWFPQSVIDAVPNAPFRASGTSQVYALNAEGFRRRILNPEVYNSYGWASGDIYEVTAAELAGYPETDLVSPEGSSKVYQLSTKQLVSGSSWPNVGSGQGSVHVINEIDFQAYSASTVTTGLNVPWDVAVLPDGALLVTERPGTLRRIGTSPWAKNIADVSHYGEGGLMGIALHPDFAANHYLYLYYTATDGANRVTRFTLEGDVLTEDKVIVKGIPSAIYHDGGQIAFGPDGLLYIATGDASNDATAPDLSSLAGKTLRVTADGGIPSDNPFGTAVWSYGHRNVQGLAWDAQGRLWETEHGRSGATSGYDELNLIVKGKNYGWPNSEGATVLAGTVGPVRQSTATVTWAPSGMAFVDGTLFYAGLRGSRLYAVDVSDNGTISNFREYFVGTYGRLRAVVLGPDGFLYLTTSNRDSRGTVRTGDDKLIRVSPGMLK